MSTSDRSRVLGLLLAAVASTHCRSAPTHPNVLLIVMDDVGQDKIGAYNVHPTPPPTPHIDAFAAEGLRFTSAWAYPLCSPTRAALLTGQHTRRLGIGTRIAPNVDHWELWAGAATTIPQLLQSAPEPWDTSFVGKWHLSAGTHGQDPQHHPELHGFAWSEGSLANLYASLTDDIPADARGYEAWEEIRNGEISWKRTYVTTEAVDDALQRIDRMREPWFLWLALPSIHTPLHVPPPDLYDGPVPLTEVALVDAMVEAMDAEIGRLLDGLPDEVAERTTVVLVGDNGTSDHGIAPPLDPRRDKGTVYAGGVRVPLIVRGPRVARGEVTDALVHAVDLLPTVADLAGIALDEVRDRAGRPLVLDGRSFVPALRDPDAPGASSLYVESFGPLGPGPYETWIAAVRDADHKYIQRSDGSEELYAVTPDVLDEGTDLLAAPEAIDGATEARRAALETILLETMAALD